ncbi:NUDIX hydrolase [Kineococcus sp. SYSU DK004]|uniref:NUDIX hydrolase n=1 Tax=Kineococcus sp. SYSU DK004 TaxID=3383125 RepID=UPI003D7C9B6D
MSAPEPPPVPSGRPAPGAEQVALYDPHDAAGRVVGSAPRALVRARNLPHAATGVLLRDARGRVLVHRRTTVKDVYPGRHDCLAGGVVGAGEDPALAAERELAEELGVRGVPLRPVLRRWYRDERTCFLAHVFTARVPAGAEDALVLQPEEVAGAWWEEPARLRDLLADPAWPFVPDSRALLAAWPGWWRDDGRDDAAG